MKYLTYITGNGSLKEKEPIHMEDTLPPLFHQYQVTLSKERIDEYTYKKGQNIFYEGNQPIGLYYIKSGKIKIFKSGSCGREKIIRIAEKEDFLGYKDILSGTPYTISATVVENTHLYFIPKREFIELMQLKKEIGEEFTQRLCKDLEETENNLVDICYKPVRGRLAQALLALTMAKDGQSNGHIIDSFSREDLANMVATARETVTRLLAEFKKEKLISIEGRYIKVLNPEKLQEVINLYS